jgi:hypothetical protein
MEASAVKLAKAACPNNIHEQGSYISGYLQAIDMIFDWDNDEVDELAAAPNLQPYNCFTVEGELD